MTSHCPHCRSALDPTRAPVARVHQGRVVTYCSVQCAEQGPAEQGVAPIPTPLGPPPIPDADGASDVVDHEDAEADFAYDNPREFSGATDLTPTTRRRWLVVVGFIGLIAGGILAVKYFGFLRSSKLIESKPSSRAAESKAPSVAPSAESQAQKPTQRKPIDPYDAAITRLTELMGGPSPRIRQKAASALARTGDEKAIQILDHALTDETNPLARVVIAYVLARAGVDRGTAELTSLLNHKRRDVRLDAARSFVQLGSEKGVKQLRQMMNLRNYRVSAVRLLARLGHEDAQEVLHGIATSTNSTEEKRMRAIVALGTAGDSSVRDQLIDILNNPGFKVGAADALARLGDAAAVPALEAQLQVPGVRVKAALALRRLSHKTDIKPLVDIMENAHDIAQVSAAEAILILTGPAKIATRD